MKHILLEAVVIIIIRPKTSLVIETAMTTL